MLLIILIQIFVYSQVAEVTALPDPCPLPGSRKRRGLGDKDRLLYAPMADVGGLLYDKDAVYIDIPDWKAWDCSSEACKNFTVKSIIDRHWRPCFTRWRCVYQCLRPGRRFAQTALLCLSLCAARGSIVLRPSRPRSSPKFPADCPQGSTDWVRWRQVLNAKLTPLVLSQQLLHTARLCCWQVQFMCEEAAVAGEGEAVDCQQQSFTYSPPCLTRRCSSRAWRRAAAARARPWCASCRTPAAPAWTLRSG